MGIWISHQKTNYNIDVDKCKQLMKNSEIYNKWIEFINNNKYKQYIINSKELWIKRLEEVKKYIDENNKSPSSTSKDKNIKQIGIWIGTQKANYDIDITKCKEGIKDEEIYNKWTEFITDNKYKQYIIIDFTELWINKLEKVKKYIDTNNKSPSQSDKDEDIKQMGSWISNQKKNYDIDKCKHSMQDDNIYNKWTEFINDNKYKQYIVIDFKELWMNKLEEVKIYIDKNKKTPSRSDEDIKHIGDWIHNQKTKYNIDIDKCKHSMKDEEIYNKWTEFINNNKYNKYMIDSKELWMNKLEDVKKYIDTNNKRPSNSDKIQDIKQIAVWIGTQNKNYNIDIDKCKQSMKDKEIYNKWTEFINDNKYKQYIIIDFKELWLNKLEEVREYINTNNKRPSSTDKDEEIKQIGMWISTQKKNYSKNENIMKDDTIKKAWKNFINDIKYNKYFLKD